MLLTNVLSKYKFIARYQIAFSINFITGMIRIGAQNLLSAPID